ncbi:unnamed protein product [Nezara viridula]|uniref:Uncharacterized protein n=1 Tax=Nezara viridula TaxID=85310 RepID=A0A9P0EGK8_NEZVI|nr:unnamed protein product [Nezara viridula]
MTAVGSRRRLALNLPSSGISTMTNTIVSNMVENVQDLDGPLLESKSNSPSIGKPKSHRNPPRGQQFDFDHEWNKISVSFGYSSYNSPRRSRNGKSRGTPSKSPRQSPLYSVLYEGFGDSPAPADLPMPPSRWMTYIQHKSACINHSCSIEAARFGTEYETAAQCPTLSIIHEIYHLVLTYYLNQLINT